MNFRILILFFLLICSFTNSYGQKLETFSEDIPTFYTELEQIMVATKNPKKVEAFEAFGNAYKLGRFDEPTLAIIRSHMDKILKKGMSRGSYFTDYLNCLGAATKDINANFKLKEWHNTLDQIIDNLQGRKFKPYSEFLEFSEFFFKNKLIRYSKSGVNWKAIYKSFDWKFEEGQPVIYFEKTDLQAMRKKDSTLISETSGKYIPNLQIWKGKGGKITWERHGFTEDVFAEIGDYEFEAKTSYFKAENSKLKYPTFFGAKTIEGTFEDKLVVGNKATGGSYPRFESTDKRIKIDRIGEGIEFTGGFKFEGTTVYGNGTNDLPAQIIIKNDAGEKKYKGLGESFTIKKEEQLKASKVETTIYFGKDSIYHPSVSIRFDIPSREMNLQRGKKASDRGPFWSSMHKINFNTDNVICKLNTDSIFIGKPGVQITGEKSNTVIFESIEYFREREFTKMQNVASYNPISMLKLVINEEGDEFKANYFAKKIDPKLGVENIKGLLYLLVEEGFIDYDSENEIVKVRDKVSHFTEANAEKKDYDYLKITSESTKTNAVLTTSNSEMEMEGVKNVEFSAVQKVGLLPRGETLTMMQNRNMDFNGKVFAGFTSLIGKDMHFQYDPNHIVMDSVKYFDIFVPSGLIDEANPNATEQAFSVSSRIEDFNGVLLIDAPSNKSGVEDIEIFPSMQSKGPAFVYYDKMNKQGGVYKRDSFYFELEPFSFNSLDKFSESDLNFAGQLNSWDVFPKFDESLIMMKQDSSLGFITRTPPEGYPAYAAKGKYNGEITLSNEGLLGKGTTNYLGAEIDSEDIIFHPKLMTCTAEQFDLDEVRNADPEFPEAEGKAVSIEWRPYRDSMYIRSKEENFSIYKPKEHGLAGTLILTPGGLKGVGNFEWDKAKMNSELFNFGAFSVTADTTDVKIKAFDADEFALSTSNLNADVDFDDQEGLFKANDEFLQTTLPYNQYQTTMNEFTWDMANHTITFAALPGKLGSFTSIHPDQDSLFFQGETAFYDLKNNQLKIGGVPFIKSCDAFLYTETGDIEILPGGVMTTLNNAKIVCDTVNQNHTINRATIDVLGKKDYKASGYYEYNIGDRQQEIFFQEIVGARVGKGSRSEKATETRATGAVEEGNNFYVDHKTKFLGDIGLRSSSTDLRFDGFAKLDTKTLPNSTWFSVQSEAAKEDLKIKFDVPKTMDGENLHTGLYLSKETAMMYPRVLQQKFFRKDDPILPVSGLFKYDQKKDEFIFSDSSKMNKIGFKGNQIVFNNKTGKVDMEGTFNICDSLKYLSVDVVGAANSTYGSSTDTSGTVPFSVDAQFMAGINLLLPKRLYKYIIKDFKSAGFEGDPVIYSPRKDFYKRAVAEIVPETSKDYAEVMSGLNIGAFDLPKKMNDYSLFFSYLPMKWDMDYQSFVSSEAKVGLYSINGEPFNMQVTAYVEFKMPTNNDDRLYVYLKSPSGYYYFFGFKQGVLNVVSDNMEFNDEVINLKKKEATVKMGKDEFFEIFPVEPSSANMFMRRVQAAAKGGE